MSVGMVIMRPTSVAVTGAGSSASIRAAGGVEFTSATDISLNGVFTADYDDYMITMRFTNTSIDADVLYRLRASGTDASGSNYTYQFLKAASTTVSGNRATTTSGILGTSSNDQRDGAQMFLYGPNLAQPTAVRTVTVPSVDNAQVLDIAVTHSLSTAYDGITFTPQSSAFSGLITVFGLAQ